jgi:diguanylate cyclase (GGDEF)-like protein
VFVLFFFLRRKNRPPDDFADTATYSAWRWRHWGLIHAGCLLWGAVFTYVGWVERDYRPQLTIALICSVMFGGALSQAFAMEKRQTITTLALLYGPALALCAVVPALRAVGLTLAIYSLYLLSSLRRLAREYDAQIATEYALLLSRGEVEKLTRIDVLTGLANRREYQHVYPQAWHQAVRQGLELTLVVFDLDDFKGLNDRSGHLAGDACLQHFARLLRSHFRREADLLARIGGEEFVALLPGVGGEEAARMAEHFRATLARTPCGWRGELLAFTVSIGVGAARRTTDSQPEATFARADQACYEAKTMGRNRVVLARTGETAPPPAAAS